MSKDRIYTSDGGMPGSFEFSDEVAKVFPDMLERSIPGYAMTIAAITSLARRYVRANTACYDLGCSLGAAALAMQRGITAPGCRIVAVDNAPAMIERCRNTLPDAGESDAAISLLEADIHDVPISNASMVVMNYTLQFIAPAERPAILRKVRDGLNERGIFVVSEKVADLDETIEELLVDLHHGFKRRNAYSDLEISRKRAALENVLIPESIETHRERLQQAGFSHVGVWLRHFNFVSLVAIR